MPASGLGRVGRPRGGRGAKRTAEEMHELCEKVASFVKTHPGLRIELINKELGTATKELALPIRKLLADSVITSKGEKRATTYFPGKKAFKG
jgi:predicted transcriptional regulator